ncbi:MAG: hypothetical protein INR73_18735 [Williamsia sp.]|nr:hypothetical protein [Williamsia sp.]
MNWITRLVNHIDDWLSPLAELAKDEHFRAELLASVGAREKASPQDKAKTDALLTKLLQVLDDVRKATGSGQNLAPKVSNIVALGLLLAELYKVFGALYEMLESCDWFGLESEEGDTPDEDRETAIVNAVRAVSRFLTLNLFKNKVPALAAWADATGVFSDEYNETKRALDLVLYPLIALTNQITGIFDGHFNTDFLRPAGDQKPDDHQRITRGIFLILSVISTILEKRIKGAGKFLFNFGYELSPAKDPFPLAAGVADRLMQMQFIPGAYFDPEQDEWIGDELFGAAFRDSFLSFATLPVFPPDHAPGAQPLGFQYLLGMELNPGDPVGGGAEPGTGNGRFSLSFPANVTGNLLWGHGIEPTASTAVQGPILVARFAGAQPAETAGTNTVHSGDISFVIELKDTIVGEQPKKDAEFRLAFNNFGLSLSGEGRDGFLQKILPDSAAAKVNASFSIVYSALLNKFSLQGLDGNEGLLLLFKVDKKLFGALNIPSIYMGVKPLLDEAKTARGISLESSAMIALALGPFALSVDRLGFQLNLGFPKNAKGNLGGANLDIGLKPPTGIGFLVKAAQIQGGGFLSIDQQSHQYYGAGELSVKLGSGGKESGLTLKVVAVILTRLPDGKKGFSFLLLATVEFTPAFDLPFGFKLKGVGVLVALHRSMNLENLQNAVKDDRFNSILFPDNPVANAPAIVSTMNALFPAAEGRYVFAIMARIGWGTSGLVDIKAGLLIEVPDPVKLALAGVIKLTVEAGGKKILRFQVNFLVALDLEKKIFSIDAAIYDSKFLVFDIKGQLFLRYRWGADPVFLFAVGGWHPAFQVPGGLNLPQKPQRITVPLLDGANPSLVLSCYIAFTSNTVQAGFAIDFKMRWSKFRLEAGLSVDALFHFDPFYFVVDFEGKLRIFWGDSRLAGVSVKGQFSGTHPWRIKGKASFEIWIWDYEVDFDKSTGEKLTEGKQETEILPLLQAAIRDKASWQTTLPSGRSTGIVLRNTEADSQDTSQQQPGVQPILTDPFARLELMQQVVPLAIRIDKRGPQRAKGYRKFDLAPFLSAQQQIQVTELQDYFAPALFLDLNDAQKLSRKSFERMKAGCAFSDQETVSTGAVQVSPFSYENAFYDPLAPVVTTPAPALPETHFQRWASNNSAGRSEQGRQDRAAREVMARQPVQREPAYVLADAVSGNRISAVPPLKSMTNAYYELWKIQKDKPFSKIQVVQEQDLV